MKYPRFLLIILFFFTSIQLYAQEGLEADETQEALEELRMARQHLLQSEQANDINQLLYLGLWDKIPPLLTEEIPSEDAQAIAQAHYYFLTNDFPKSEQIVKQVLARSPQFCPAKLLRARLYIESWELKKAIPILESCTVEEPEAAYWLGKILLYQKRYLDARDLAVEMKKIYPQFGLMHLLEGEAYFWLRDMSAAEDALKGALYYDPFNADARFYYGYAIWRRVDATQLPAMAAQWQIALEVNPLHYLTHWHWGNGHTQLTFNDYIDADEDSINKQLEKVEKLISANQIADAIKQAEQVQADFPKSVLPAMIIGSAHYMDYGRGDERLEDAEQVFRNILNRKNNYGPAHNALAAVIKQKRIPYLAVYDSLEKLTSETEISTAEMKAFQQLFPDMAYYPGDRVQKMIWNQLHASKVYFPFLNKLGRKFVIPPLHIDLARAMNNNYFRGNTTFDNRQWMDIRGVGSGATAIEYVERGAHQERNVTLHEYVHLFHMTVFTDAEKRRIRQLYANAMENDLTLDYYAANNEHEYLAQTYTAYFAPVKVHPLNHKSVNTRNDLLLKDRELFDFLSRLVGRQKAYLAGDERAMASNWAAVYTRLAEKGLQMGYATASTFAYLDSALQWDKQYLPAYLALARAHYKKGEPEQAQQQLDLAQKIDSTYAPIYVTQAGFEATAAKEKWLLKAYELETDFSERADVQRKLRSYYLSQADYKKAIQIASSYAQEVPTFSTYLRDRKREAEAFVYQLQAELGAAEKPLAFFQEAVVQRPQDYSLRQQYVAALSALGMHQEAIDVLSASYELLRSAGSRNQKMARSLAYHYVKAGDFSNALSKLNEARVRGRSIPDPKYVELLIALGEASQATQALEAWQPVDQRDRAQKAFLQGLWWEKEGKSKLAITSFEEALAIDPVLMPAVYALLDVYEEKNKQKDIKALVQSLVDNPLIGEEAQRRLKQYVK